MVNLKERDAGKRELYFEIEIKASPKIIWDAWTTEEGIKSFFASTCFLELRPGGAYEMYFDPDAPEGSRGGEGCRILAMQEPHMLSITWNNPPDVAILREQHQFTHVMIRIMPISEENTRVSLTHDGWGISEDWDRAFSYFSRAWGEYVLPGLKRYLEVANSQIN